MISNKTAFYDGFYPVDQPSVPLVGPDPTPTDANGVFAMPFPDLGIPDLPLTEATPCFLFRTELMGNPFKIEESGSETAVGQHNGRTVEGGFDRVGPHLELTAEIEKNSLPSVSVYPNPLVKTGHLNISLVNHTTNATASYILTDMTGKVLKQDRFDGHQTSVLLENIASGIYNLNVRTEDVVDNQVIIVP